MRAPFLLPQGGVIGVTPFIRVLHLGGVSGALDTDHSPLGGAGRGASSPFFVLNLGKFAKSYCRD